MFSGIVHHCAPISQLFRQSAGINIEIITNFDDLVLGESIAVNGICLTQTLDHLKVFKADVSIETLVKTDMKVLEVGSLVNLERSLSVGQTIGGHWVTGHIDQVGTIKTITALGGYLEVVITNIDKHTQDYLIEKGSVTINGVSLTINRIMPQGFAVMLIPHTINTTTFKQLHANDIVNLEFDYLAKITVAYLRRLSLPIKNCYE